MKESPSKEPNVFWAGQEVYPILYYPNVNLLTTAYHSLLSWVRRIQFTNSM